MDDPYRIYLATLVFNSVYISTMNGEYDLLVEFNYFPGVHSAGEQRRCSILASPGKIANVVYGWSLSIYLSSDTCV